MATQTNIKREQQGQTGGQIQRAEERPRSTGLGPVRGSVGSPFAMMRRMFENMDRLFGDYGFGGDELGLDLSRSLPRGLWSPQIEVREKDGKLLVHADLPGLKPEDIQVNIEDDVLTVSGERRNESENDEGGVYRSERSYGRFERRIVIPAGVDPNAIDAKFENGVLELSAPLPKYEPRGRKIEIKGSGSRDTKQQH